MSLTSSNAFSSSNQHLTWRWQWIVASACSLFFLASSACDDSAAPPQTTDAGLARDGGNDAGFVGPTDAGSDAGQACDCDPAPDVCASGDEVLRTVAAGCDDDGECIFETEVISCTTPPAPYCADDGTRIDFAATGECELGVCVYEEVFDTCEVLPNDFCLGPDALAHFAEAGSCEEGECSFESVTLECGLGCCDDHCCAAHPSETEWGALVENGRIAGPPSGTFHTEDDCIASSSLGDCSVVIREDETAACVCRADEMHIADLQVRGPHALVLLAAFTVDVSGELSVAAVGTQDGAGATYRYGDGEFGSAGGSFGSRGAGNSADVYGDAELAPLVGGMRGEKGCSSANGGGGGGALVVAAGETITVTGALNAGGGGGSGGGANAGCGAGGGSGGALLLEAPSVVVTGVAAANGGGGGSGGTDSRTGYAGSDGRAAAAVASGGAAQSEETCILGGTLFSGAGGRGAAEGQAPTTGGFGRSVTDCLNSEYSGPGGSGGGLGRIRINTESGCLCNGVFSPLPTFGSLRVE